MTETWVEIIGVGLLIVIAIAAIANMKSPSRGADSMGVVIEELQKSLEPQVKQIRKAKEKKNIEEKQGKKGMDGDGDVNGDANRGSAT
jgi:hypothetical protein